MIVHNKFFSIHIEK